MNDISNRESRGKNRMYPSTLRTGLAVATATLAATLGSTPAIASAAPQLQFAEVTRGQSTVHKNDRRVDYAVTIRNSGDATTSGTTILALALPAGVKLGAATGAGWTCALSTRVCVNSTPIASDASFGELALSLWLDDLQIGDTLKQTFTAFGGGAPLDVIATDTIQLAPAIPFDITDLRAGACSEPGAAANASNCFTAFGSSDFTKAGGHPHGADSSLTLSYRLDTRPKDTTGPYDGYEPTESLRDLYFDLPAGFIGNLEASTEMCTFSQVKLLQCPSAAAVGALDVETEGTDVTGYELLYRIVPEDGYVAAFANRPVAFGGDLTYVIRVKVRSSGDYGVTAIAPLPPQTPKFFGIRRATLCSYGVEFISGTGNIAGCKTAAEAPGVAPFLSNPTRCGGDAPTTVVHVDSYEQPARRTDEGWPDLSDSRWKSRSVVSPAGTDCTALTAAWTGSQAPSLTLQPDSPRADAAAGYTAKLHIPQDGLTDPDGLATSHLKDTVVTLPDGIALNPSAADGLGACSLEQAGYLGNDFPAPNHIRFKTTAVGCPDNSKVGTATVSTPVLPDSLPGAVFLAAQKANPFGSDFAIYLVVDDAKTGIKATLPGKVETDPVSGRITTTFAENPQVPVGDVELKFFSGSRAALANPDVCGTYTTSTQLSPWSAADPYAPLASEVATSTDSVAIDAGVADGVACPTSKDARPFGAALSSGMAQATAGGYSPFHARFTKSAGDQEFDRIELSTPPGFTARLAGIPYCSEAGIARATARTATGDGVLERSDPSCSEASRVGTTTIGAGAGSNPIFVKGNVYLAGPYQGQPLSLVFVVPAVAGPFDLGVQVVRTALEVDSKTAQVTALSDRIPMILRGIPLRVRDIRVDIDREKFTLNPTDCSAKQTAGSITGNPATVAVTNAFQASGCAALPFKPKLTMALTGRRQVSTGKHPGIKAQVTQTGVGEAGIEKAVVRLPKSLALDPDNAQALCEFVDGTKPDLENHCPKGSVVGRARATTPLLDDPLVGNVYFVKNVRIDAKTGNQIRTLPMIIVALRGQIAINLVGESNTTKAGKLVNTFNGVPDAPVSQFNLNIKGGSKGILAVTRTRRARINLCAKPNGHTAEADMNAHNGRRHDRNIRMKTPCTKRQTKAAKRQAKRAAAKARN